MTDMMAPSPDSGDGAKMNEPQSARISFHVPIIEKSKILDPITSVSETTMELKGLAQAI